MLDYKFIIRRCRRHRRRLPNKVRLYTHPVHCSISASASMSVGEWAKTWTQRSLVWALVSFAYIWAMNFSRLIRVVVMLALWTYFASRILVSYEKLQKKSIGTLFNRINLDKVKGGDWSVIEFCIKGHIQCEASGWGKSFVSIFWVLCLARAAWQLQYRYNYQWNSRINVNKTFSQPKTPHCMTILKSKIDWINVISVTEY